MPSGNPSLITSDVDGTLLNDQNKITSLTLDVITRAYSAGVELVLATGRPVRWIGEVTDQLPTPGDINYENTSGTLVKYAVCANGAIVYDVKNDQILDAVTLDVHRLHKLIAVIKEKFPQAALAVERAEVFGSVAGYRSFVATSGYGHAWLNPDHELVDDVVLGEEPAVKLLAWNPHMNSEDMYAMLVPDVGDLAEITFSTSNGLVELSMSNTNKAAGLVRLIGLTGLPVEFVIAFGDMPNDVEMLRWATYGVAMGNGHPDVISACDEVAQTNNDDGVAKVLSRFF